MEKLKKNKNRIDLFYNLISFKDELLNLIDKVKSNNYDLKKIILLSDDLKSIYEWSVNLENGQN